MSPAFLSGILVVALYFVASLASASTVLVIQRKFFLHPDEDQSFAVPGITAFFVGVLYFWMVVTLDVQPI